MSSIDKKALYSLSYGLFVLTTNDGTKANGCIVNTCMQVTENPTQLCVCVNKANYTAQTVSKTKKFAVSILTTGTPFSVFEHFGFRSGRDVDKFSDFSGYALTQGGLPYLAENCNAFFEAEVTQEIDCGTHIMFIAKVTQAEVLNSEESVTYAYYFANIKPKPEAAKKKGYVCKICGYVHEGEELPDDFVCPWCKHPASDFEPLK